MHKTSLKEHIRNLTMVAASKTTKLTGRGFTFHCIPPFVLLEIFIIQKYFIIRFKNCKVKRFLSQAWRT